MLAPFTKLNTAGTKQRDFFFKKGTAAAGEETMERLHINWPLLAALLINGFLWAVMLFPMGL